jgi:hypothetical protein
LFPKIECFKRSWQKNQAYIAIDLEELTQRPLKFFFGNLFKIEDLVQQVTGKFSVFGISGKRQ